MKIKQAVILCGGRGERLRPITDKIPKPMVLINKKPFLYYLMLQLSKKGISNFLLLTGYKGDLIEKYFDNGKKFGWSIKYSRGPIEWRTGQRILKAEKLIYNKFILLYSDNFINFNYFLLLNKHLSENKTITLLLVKKKNGNIALSKSNTIKRYDPKRTANNLNYVELGYMLINKPNLIKDIKSNFKNKNFNFSLLLEIYSKMKKLNNIIVNNSYYSISDPKRLKITKDFFNNKKILLLDRDGIINHKAVNTRYVEDWSQFKFIKENIRGLQTLSKLGFKFIIITNQAAVSLGIISLKKLNNIHRKMIMELKKKDIEVLKVYFSPDHFEDFKSDTRKPAPGLFYSASKDFKINLDGCLYVGDDIRDCLGSYNAGFNSIFIGQKNSLKSLNKNQYPLKVSKNINNLVEFINNFYNKYDHS
tara:strand:- start:187 stop:1443 length:1257 start_codon:yes stop_codon:yes gene_type:complete